MILSQNITAKHNIWYWKNAWIIIANFQAFWHTLNPVSEIMFNYYKYMIQVNIIANLLLDHLLGLQIPEAFKTCSNTQC